MSAARVMEPVVLRQAVDALYLRAKARRLSPDTQLFMRKALEPLLAVAGQDLPVAELSPDHICAYMVHPTWSKTTLYFYFAWVERLCRQLVNAGLVERSPCAGLRPKLPKGLPKPLGRETIAAMLAAAKEASPRDHAMLHVFYGAGLRMAELHALDVGDVALGELGPCVIVEKGKGDKERVVPLSQEAWEAVQAWLAVRMDHPGQPALFITQKRRRGVRARLSEAQIRDLVAKYDVSGVASPHKIRHSFASHLIESGAPPRVVQEMMGHSSAETTERYTHVTQASVRRWYDAHHPVSVRPRDDYPKDNDDPNRKGGIE